jgi:hypothetical protein
MAESGPALLIVALGVAVIASLMAFALIRVRALQKTAEKLVELALGGHADEARIQARNANRDLLPLVDALGGELSRPSIAPVLKDALMLAAVPLPALALSIYGLAQMSAPGEGAVGTAASLLVGLAFLIPISFAAGFAIVALRRCSGRIVRGCHVTLLARNVRASTEPDTADTVRRAPRDARGD